MRPNLINQRNAAKAKKKAEHRDERVYVSLEKLLRLQHKATGFSFFPRQPVTSVLSGKHASCLRGRGLNFEELRQYHQGDDIRTIDWKVTARTRHAHVRVFSEERDRSTLFLVDQRLHMFFGSVARMKSVAAAEIAALGAWRALSMGDRVGALVFNDSTVNELRPQRSKQHVMQILRNIEAMNRQLRADAQEPSNAEQLNAVLEKALRLAKHDTLVVIISDFQGVNDQTAKLTAQLAAHNDVLGMHLVDPMRANPRRGSSRGMVTDGQRQMELDLQNKTMLKRIAREYAEELESIRSHMRKLSAPLLPINTVDDVAAQIRQLIGTESATR